MADVLEILLTNASILSEVGPNIILRNYCMLDNLHVKDADFDGD